MGFVCLKSRGVVDIRRLCPSFLVRDFTTATIPIKRRRCESDAAIFIVFSIAELIAPFILLLVACPHSYCFIECCTEEPPFLEFKKAKERSLQPFYTISNATTAYVCFALAIPILRIGPVCAHFAYSKGQTCQAQLPIISGSFPPRIIFHDEDCTPSPRPKISQSNTTRKAHCPESHSTYTTGDIPAILQFFPGKVQLIPTRRIRVALAATEDAVP